MLRIPLHEPLPILRVDVEVGIPCCRASLHVILPFLSSSSAQGHHRRRLWLLRRCLLTSAPPDTPSAPDYARERLIACAETRNLGAEVMDTPDTAVERGSGNVFADLGLPDADIHLLKAELVSCMEDIVRKRGTSLIETARLLGLPQPVLSRLLRGDFRDYSLVRLLHLLTALGRDIDIVIRQPHSPSGGKLRVVVEPV